MIVVCFEDSHVDDLQPVAIARPAYAITCAGYRLLDWLEDLPGKKFGSVRSHLQMIQELDLGLKSPPSTLSDSQWSDDKDGVLLINARLCPSVATRERLVSFAKSNQSCVIVDTEDQSVLAARITAGDLAKAIEMDAASNKSATESLLSSAMDLKPIAETLSVFRWPHDIVKLHMQEMPASMNDRLRRGNYQEIMDGVFAGANVKVGEYAVVDSSEGPIVFEDNVNVGPFCYLSGPVHAGRGTRVIEHAALKDGVALGHTVKIGGEVEASVIEPYTNKQHHGFLGHSYLGSWINLGAGTCNSDLKNTYGKINITYGNDKVATGMQFLGCFIGDYSKTAINTSIFTGKVIGVCSMMYGFVTSNVPSYVNYARLFGQTSLLPADVMINTQKRMFARRKVEQRECDKQLIRDMYALTAGERAADPDLL
ncbi:Bifunctional protein GlmU [Rubripirellula amarantea]|uniref:Bifunctional protein GlmU n=1 Tax=Rubripirellula amarantea TaxID=2527999 RepID=A0A5C5WS56_9BACT|nr:putative sugar nucleotidyl transferase [Rubripirellula amarantea]TWT52612.1 Bifunctional protein GlmU [Rubripirellula amarantea]